MTVLLGWIGTALVLVSYAQPNVSRLRRLSLVASVVLIAFNLLLGIWSNVVLEAVLVAVNIARLRSDAGGEGTARWAPTPGPNSVGDRPIFHRRRPVARR